MKINLNGIVVVVGAYGSGKTEVCINLAVSMKHEGVDVRVADLDLVNPYFRTREARGLLSNMKIDLVLPPDMYMQADLPILTPAISGMIRRPAELTLLDAGGNDAGATVLAALGDSLKGKNVHMLQVVNPFRPFTDTIRGCLKIRDEIEKASKINMTGIIGNPNLIDETTPADILSGYDFVKNLSGESGLPLEFITVAAEFLPEIKTGHFSCPVLPIARQLVPPWKKAANYQRGV
ncbi:MAG: cobalamin biosynthesis protein CbiA [Desulfobacteraceae bacterium]|nr:cobalamin biosynthesis protein CbiA [Desulfobacteraceae bacterium]